MRDRRAVELRSHRLRWRCLLALNCVSSVVTAPSAQGQCRDPLFATHWDGKNDIQTLTAFPHVRTNLRLCPEYNQRASCCRQMFESEQHKYYDFWIKRLRQKLRRADAHRQAVAIASVPNAGRVAEEQRTLALSRYLDVLRPSSDQSRCLSELLTYAAGMICFGCKPEWSRYVELSEGAGGDDAAYKRVLRVRIARATCDQLWAACLPFSLRVARLTEALRDSTLARAASVAWEPLEMFEDQERLCDWMHDNVALTPFVQPPKEDSDVKAVPQPGVVAAAPGVPAASRRLVDVDTHLDALAEGRKTTFDRTWHPQGDLSFGSGACGGGRIHALVTAALALLTSASARVTALAP